MYLRLLGEFPNTYGFTKSMAEDLAYEYSDRLPIAVGRPAIGNAINLYFVRMEIHNFIINK